MKKSLCISFIFILFVSLTGCGNHSPFKGVILEVKTSSIVVGARNVDPSASYPGYRIIVDNETEITGKVRRFADLKKNQKVDIWVRNKGSHQKMANNRVAKKIVVK